MIRGAVFGLRPQPPREDPRPDTAPLTAPAPDRGRQAPTTCGSATAASARRSSAEGSVADAALSAACAGAQLNASSVEALCAGPRAAIVSRASPPSHNFYTYSKDSAHSQL